MITEKLEAKLSNLVQVHQKSKNLKEEKMCERGRTGRQTDDAKCNTSESMNLQKLKKSSNRRRMKMMMNDDNNEEKMETRKMKYTSVIKCQKPAQKQIHQENGGYRMKFCSIESAFTLTSLHNSR